MTDLLPCWKCGSPAHMLPTIDARVMIACPESGLGAEHGAWVIEDTEAEAIAAWNTRAERTCHIKIDKVGLAYCDHCEESAGRGASPRWAFSKHTNYCPNCGSKVVEE